MALGSGFSVFRASEDTSVTEWFYLLFPKFVKHSYILKISHCEYLFAKHNLEKSLLQTPFQEGVDR